jgi:hypothetical protein
MQVTNTPTWDSPLEEDPTTDDDPKDQADFVSMVVVDARYPGRPQVGDYWAESTARGFKWRPVFDALGLKSVKLPEQEGAGGESDVPITLAPITKRVIGTWLVDWRNRYRPAAPTLTGSAKYCENGIGSLLRRPKQPTQGRDVQLACKRTNCPACGPRRLERRTQKMQADLIDLTIHAVVVDDCGDEWEALHQKLKRAHHSYQRIPAPDGKAVIFTTAEVGELLREPGRVVEEVLALQPCQDGRRATSSRDWKERPRKSSWERLGLSAKPLTERLDVYRDHGVAAKEVTSQHPDVVRSHDLTLPTDKAELGSLTKDLGMEGAEEVEGW